MYLELTIGIIVIFYFLNSKRETSQVEYNKTRLARPTPKVMDDTIYTKRVTTFIFDNTGVEVLIPEVDE